MGKRYEDKRMLYSVDKTFVNYIDNEEDAIKYAIDNKKAYLHVGIVERMKSHDLSNSSFEYSKLALSGIRERVNSYYNKEMMTEEDSNKYLHKLGWKINEWIKESNIFDELVNKDDFIIKNRYGVVAILNNDGGGYHFKYEYTKFFTDQQIEYFESRLEESFLKHKNVGYEFYDIPKIKNGTHVDWRYNVIERFCTTLSIILMEHDYKIPLPYEKYEVLFEKFISHAKDIHTSYNFLGCVFNDREAEALTLMDYDGKYDRTILQRMHFLFNDIENPLNGLTYKCDNNGDYVEDRKKLVYTQPVLDFLTETYNNKIDEYRKTSSLYDENGKYK